MLCISLQNPIKIKYYNIYVNFNFNIYNNLCNPKHADWLVAITTCRTTNGAAFQQNQSACNWMPFGFCKRRHFNKYWYFFLTKWNQCWDCIINSSFTCLYIYVKCMQLLLRCIVNIGLGEFCRLNRAVYSPQWLMHIFAQSPQWFWCIIWDIRAIAIIGAMSFSNRIFSTKHRIYVFQKLWLKSQQR